MASRAKVWLGPLSPNEVAVAPDEMSQVFAALAEIIYQGSDANEMYAAICIAAASANETV